MIQLPSNYFATAGTFLFRPRRFFTNRDSDPSAFVGPSTFAIVNIVLAGIAATTAAKLFGENWRAPSRLESIATFAVIAFVHCVIAVGVGKLAGLLLNERTDATELLSAFCYTSVFYVPIALFIALSPQSPRDYDIATIAEVTSLQVAAFIYLLIAMAHASSLYGRRALAFATVTGSIVILCGIALSIAIIAAQRDATTSEEQAVRVENGAAVGAITVGFRESTTTSAMLVGAPIGATTTEWFDFDSLPSMDHSVAAKNGVGIVRNLQPRTKYYFRYVAQHGNITCRGETKSFTTPER